MRQPTRTRRAPDVHTALPYVVSQRNALAPVHLPPIESWLALLNPVSASGRGARERPRIERALRDANVPFQLEVAAFPGHAKELVHKAAVAGVRRFIAIGGDGTLHEVVNGIFSAGLPPGSATVGLIPLGRGNDWARMSRIPRAVESAADLIGRARAVLHDVGIVELDAPGPGAVRYFINVAGVGFDAHVVERTRAVRLGRLTYLAGLLRGFLTFRAPSISLVTGEVRREGPMFLAFAALGRYCGAGMLVAPDASPSDGLFDVVTVDALTKLELLVNLRRLFDGTLTRHPKVQLVRSASLRVDATPPAQVEADGELLGRTPVTFRVLPGAVRMVVP